MKVRIKKLVDNAKVPTQAHSKDFCYDVYATSCKRIGFRTYEYCVGLAYEIVRGDENVGEEYQYSYDQENQELYAKSCISHVLRRELYNNVKLSIDFRPRSSIFQTGMILSNCEGTLDELYRGEIKAIFYHIHPFKKKYKVGDRIGQVKLGFTLPIEWEVVDELDEDTERGTNGFGSTGRN